MRKSGRTTRLVDGLVQELFNTGFCYVEDHYGSILANKMILRKLLDRLDLEHHLNVKEDLTIIKRSLGTHLVEFKGNCSGNGQ